MRRLFEVFSNLWNLFIGVRLVSVPLLFGLVTVLTLVILVRTDHVQSGFTGKTIWDWMEVLGVPVVVGVIAGGFAIWGQRASQRAEQDRERDTERARETALREYLDRMSDLMLNHKLHDSPEESPARAVAKARTLSALRSLDGTRKGILVRFLQESNLISKDHRVVSLEGADLTGSDLSFTNLQGSDLSGADLRHAEFVKADLREVNFSNSVISNAILREANLGNSVISNAILREANLRDSIVSHEQLKLVADLVGAIMPDGTDMTEDRWGTFKVPQL